MLLLISNLRSYIQKFASKNAQKISAVMMASKMFTILVLLALAPIDTIKVKAREPYQTKIKFDQTNPFSITSTDRQVAVATGSAAIDRKSGSTSTYVAYQSVERDPSYFRSLYQRAGQAYGVPWQLLEAVHYVETGASDSTNESSYAGATGPMQFMPGTWRTYAVDGDGDGQANINDVDDAVYGAANLLAAGGAAEGNIDAALFNYNHAGWYVTKVKNIAYDAGMPR